MAASKYWGSFFCTTFISTALEEEGAIEFREVEAGGMERRLNDVVEDKVEVQDGHRREW